MSLIFSLWNEAWYFTILVGFEIFIDLQYNFVSQNSLYSEIKMPNHVWPNIFGLDQKQYKNYVN